MKIFLGKPKQPPLSLKKVREFIESHRGLHIVVEGDDLRGTIPLDLKLLEVGWVEYIKEYVAVFETGRSINQAVGIPVDIIKFTNRTALILGENFWREERITNLNPPFEGPRYIIPNL